MKRALLLMALLAGLCAGLQAQTYTSVSGSNLTDLNGNKLAQGQICFLGTDQADQPVSFGLSGGGQVLRRPSCFTVTNGAIQGGAQIPNPATTSPSGILYRITVTDTQTKQVVLVYNRVSLQGSSWDFDTYQPLGIPVPAPPNPANVTGPLNVAGDMNVTGTSTLGVTSATSLASKNIEQVRYADRFSGSDIGAKINAALADFGAPPACGTIFIPTGNYPVSTQISVNGRNGCHFVAGGIGSTVLMDGITGTPANSMWAITNSSDLLFEGMTLAGGSNTGNLTSFIGSGSEGRIVFQNIRLTASTGNGKDASNASMLAAAIYVRNYAGPFEIEAGTVIDYNAQGWVIDNTSNGLSSALNTSHAHGASFLYQTIDGIKIIGTVASVGFSVASCNFEGNGGYGINSAAGTTAFSYANNYFEANTLGDVNEAGTDFGGKIIGNRFLRQNANPSIVISTSNATKSAGIQVRSNIFQATTSTTLTIPEFVSANFTNSSVELNVYDPFTGVTVTNAAALGTGAANVAYDGNLSGSFDGGTVSNDLNDPNGAAVANYLGKLEQAGVQVATLSGSEVLTNKTLTTPNLNGGSFIMQGSGAGYGFPIQANDYGTNGGELLFYKQTGLSTAAHLYAADNGGYDPLDVDSAATFARGLTIPGGQNLANNGTIIGGIVNATTLQQAGAAVALASALPLSATLSAWSPGAIAGGACATTTQGVANATTSMAVAVSPAADPGSGLTWSGWVSAAGIVSVRLCNTTAASITPNAESYNVRVIQ